MSTHYQNNKNLEQRVSNGEELDSAMKAKLIKQTAAYERNKVRTRENYRNNEDERKQLKRRVSNGEELDPAMKAKLIKLTAAYETKKERDRMAERWMCGVCKSCSFDTLEEAEAH